MWRLPEEIEADLNSQDPQRIAAGLRDLKDCMEEFDEFELAPIGTDILKPFGSTVPHRTQLDLLHILAGYRSFEPRLSNEQINHSLVALTVDYADNYIALETSLKLKADHNPSITIEDAIIYLTRRGLTTPQQVKGASYLVSYLLAGKPEVRSATLQALMKLPNEAEYQQVIDFIVPELESEELKQIRRG